MKKYIIYFIIFFCLHFLFFSSNVLADVSLENINIYNISNSSKYIAVETEKIVNNKIIHYIFLYDIYTSEKYWIKTNDGDDIDSDMYFPSISSDGKYVTFTSRADNITNDEVGKCYDISDNVLKNCSNIFLYDVDKKESTMLMYNNNNFDADNYVSIISGDGKSIIFESLSTNLVSNNFDCSDINGVKNCVNIYKYDLINNDVYLLSASINKKINGNSVQPYVSFDGRYVTYQSNSDNIISYNDLPKNCLNYLNIQVTCSNIYLLDTYTMKTKLISFHNNKNFNDNSGNSIISADGKYVVFESYATNLSKKRQSNIYMYDIDNDFLQLVSSYNNILNNRDTFIEDLSYDGKYILYRTDSTNLSNDEGMNLYVYNLFDQKLISISHNQDILCAKFNSDNIYYYDGVLNFSKIDSEHPIIKENQEIFILKDDIEHIGKKIQISDNLSAVKSIEVIVKNINELKKSGEYIIEVSAIDEFDNIGYGKVKVFVLEKDEEPPVFIELNKIKIIKGTKVLKINDFFSAVDNIDGNTNIYIVDKGKLNLNIVGKYEIKLMSKDLSNNISYKDVEVIVYQNYNITYFIELIAIFSLIAVFIFSIIKVK